MEAKRPRRVSSTNPWLISLQVEFNHVRPRLGPFGLGMAPGTPVTFPRGEPDAAVTSIRWPPRDNVLGRRALKCGPGVGKVQGEGLVTPESPSGPFPAGRKANGTRRPSGRPQQRARRNVLSAKRFLELVRNFLKLLLAGKCQSVET